MASATAAASTIAVLAAIVVISADAESTGPLRDAPHAVRAKLEPEPAPGSTPGTTTFALKAPPTAMPALPTPAPARDPVESCGIERPDMICIPAGTFQVGADDAFSPGGEWSTPQFELHVDAFLMDRTEVTNAAYAWHLNRVGAAAPDATPGDPHAWVDGFVPTGLDDHPVTFITQPEAAAFCRHAGKRLPTEFEWERAARGANNHRYPWGDHFEDHRVRYLLTSGVPGEVRTGPVAEHPDGANQWGVLGLSGNVWEWTSSRLTPYPGAPADQAVDDLYIVSRGGSWDNQAVDVTGTQRNWDTPDTRTPTLGFRCVQGATTAP